MGNRTSTVRHRQTSPEPLPSSAAGTPNAASAPDSTPGSSSGQSPIAIGVSFLPTRIPQLATSSRRGTPSFASLPTVGDDFRITRRLGRGAFSRVYAVEHQGEERAAKMYRSAPRMARCARDELDALRAVEPSGLFLLCHATYACSGHMILVLELAICDLYAHRRLVLQGHGVADSVKAVGKTLFEGLSHLHAHGILHTDIKPENILRVRRGGDVHLVISDLGSVMHGTRQHTTHGDVTSSWYRAPELYLTGRFGAPIDVWSAACVVYEHATGVPLFHHPSHAGSLETVSTELFDAHEAVLGTCPYKNYDNAGPAPWLVTRIAKAERKRRAAPRVAHAGVALMLGEVCIWDAVRRPTAREMAAQVDTWRDGAPGWNTPIGTRRSSFAQPVAASYP
jgi:hypothetical protein